MTSQAWIVVAAALIAADVLLVVACVVLGGRRDRPKPPPVDLPALRSTVRQEWFPFAVSNDEPPSAALVTFVDTPAPGVTYGASGSRRTYDYERDGL